MTISRIAELTRELNQERARMQQAKREAIRSSGVFVKSFRTCQQLEKEIQKLTNYPD
ncbi:MAG: hypothetical protein OXR72_04990 [Gemmatimonadota bacterium]|nr:hypothetical protein [Gemmatimonadota bacterium]